MCLLVSLVGRLGNSALGYRVAGRAGLVLDL